MCGAEGEILSQEYLEELNKRPIFLEKVGAVFKVFIGSWREHSNYRIHVWTQDIVLSCTTKTIMFYLTSKLTFD